jgi:Asp-tRNA(Asn)/Glu-tRNA(Gln) amidotransferase A subunit family amidase
MAPVSLGSDTNGSLRVPASLCGVFSFKPTYGRLPRTGTFPFVDSLDHLGPFARTTRDLALAYDTLQGHDPEDHACAPRPLDPATPQLGFGMKGLRVGLLGGWFSRNAGQAARAAAAAAADAFATETDVVQLELDAAEAGRAAAYLITNSESAAFHLDRLRYRAGEFDPDTRDRFLAGALLPAAWIARAQRVRQWWLREAMKVFRSVDLLLAPATPCVAPPTGSRTLELPAGTLPLRPTLGLLAQPFSCIGLPVATVPVFAAGDLPIGVQIIGTSWREDLCLRPRTSSSYGGSPLRIQLELRLSLQRSPAWRGSATGGLLRKLASSKS